VGSEDKKTKKKQRKDKPLDVVEGDLAGNDLNLARWDQLVHFLDDRLFIQAEAHLLSALGERDTEGKKKLVHYNQRFQVLLFKESCSVAGRDIEVQLKRVKHQRIVQRVEEQTFRRHSGPAASSWRKQHRLRSATKKEGKMSALPQLCLD
jgi:hypothetical protein